MKVIKLGGSLMKTDLLQTWLEQIELHAKGQCVILPGGGVFADFIRQTQTEWKFDDLTAHQMALLSMEQYAYYCQSLSPSLVLARSLNEITDSIQQGLTPIAMASSLFHGSQQLEPNWDVSSDSISAQLALELNAEALLLIKHIPAPLAYPVNIDELIKHKIVDKAFVSHINRLSCPYYFLSSTEPAQLKTFFV